MRSTSGTLAQHIGSIRKREGFPAGIRCYETLFAIVSALFVAGIYLVGRATTHTTDPTPASLWYALLLVGFVLLAALLLLSALRSHRQGYSWRRSLPQGYGLSLAGAFLFLIGLAGTQLWQALSGSLTGLETLLLPTTLLALLGAILLVSGPLWAAWLRFPVGAAPGWAGLFPVLLSLAWIFSLGTFLTQFAHPWTQSATITDTTPSTLYSDLYTMRVDGTGQTRLTLNPRLNYFGPSWSPDGRKIAFSLGFGSGPFNLYVMNTDGSNPIQLTHLDRTCYLQRWSPDGSKLAFIAQQGSDVRTAAIYTINADGSNLKRLTHEDAQEYGPIWSPDGTRIAFGSLRGGVWHVYVMNADGSNLHLLTGMSGNKPTWSPDGRFIVFTSDVSGHNDLYVMNADGSNLHLLAASGDHAAWSPDGQHIAFESNRTGNQEIYVMNADGSGIINLSRNPGVDNILPAWSPDSREITYMTQRQAAQPDASLAQSLGIASIIIQAALLVGFLLLLVRLWSVPFGAFTLLITLNGLLLSVLADKYVLLPVAVATGLIADLLLWRLDSLQEHPVRDALFACAVPMVWSGLYFLTLSLIHGIAWSQPLWMGTIILAGLAGCGLSLFLRYLLFKGGRG